MNSTFISDRQEINAADRPKHASPAILPRIYRILLAALIVLAIAVRIFFWAYTHRTWEDALITVQHSENAAAGLGLTHTPSDGPPLHGFTSPLSVLIPLAGDLMHVGFGLELIKLVSALFGGLAVFLGFEICTYLELPPVLALGAGAYLAFEHHQILWGMAGMETQIAVVAYLYSFWCFQRRSQLEKGISLGLCLLARPDAAIWAGIACGFEIWRLRKADVFKAMAPVIGGLAAVYGPWIIFTFAYYGSPIPNTVYAKALGYPGFMETFAGALFERHFLAAAVDVWNATRHGFQAFSSLGLVYAGNGTAFEPVWDHYELLTRFMILLLIPGAAASIRRRDANAVLIYAFVGIYAAYFMFLVPKIFFWYTVPLTAVAVIGSVYGMWRLLGLVRNEAWRSSMAAGFSVLYASAFLLAMPVTMRAEKRVQDYVEDGNRKAIGLYLKSIANKGDTVGCEPLGYIGYYSRLEVYDYPGLCNRKVVQFLRKHPLAGLPRMLEFFHPTFLVLRPGEYRSPNHEFSEWLTRNYSLIRVFQVPKEESDQLLYGYRNIDRLFYVFEIKGAQAGAHAAN